VIERQHPDLPNGEHTMTGHATPEARAIWFEVIRTTRSMRRLKPAPVPNELIRRC